MFTDAKANKILASPKAMIDNYSRDRNDVLWPKTQVTVPDGLENHEQSTCGSS